MRLQKLYLHSYGVLRKLTLPFDDAILDSETNYTLDLLVGVNGTGKSTVLRSIVEIFYGLLTVADNIPYPFEIEYTLQIGNKQRSLRILNRLGADGEEVSGGQLQVWLDGEEQEGFSSRFLPEKIIIFTTGNVDDWERIFTSSRSLDTSEDIELGQLPPFQFPGRRIAEPEKRDTEKDRQFIFIRNNHLSLLTLCGLLVNIISSPEVKNRLLYDVLERTRIGELRGFSLNFNLANITKEKKYIQELSNKATRSLQVGEKELLLVFDLGTQGKSTIEELFGRKGGLGFFEDLMLLMHPSSNPPILKKVNLFLERSSYSKEKRNEPEDSPPLHLLGWLSDGEQSFLARMCLFMLLGQTEALVLLDEPEVHFNDYWKRQIVQLIDNMVRHCSSHILITTHSGITLTDVPKENILLLKRNSDYTSEAGHPRIPTLAADPNDIITGIFEAPQSTGAQGIIRVKREIIKAIALDETERKEALRKLRGQVGLGYWHYFVLRELKGNWRL
jgi:predicted ATPase